MSTRRSHDWARASRFSDVAHNLERWIDGIVLRTFSHETVTSMARHACIPVINALSELEHPCQAMADMLTLQEHFGDLRGVHLAYVGDGNNVAHSLMLAAASLGASISVGTPKGYEPDAGIAQVARVLRQCFGGERARHQRSASRRSPARMRSTPMSGPAWARKTKLPIAARSSRPSK